MPRRSHMDVHMVFREFADGTSMHGVPRIINARSLPARVFWSVICLGAFGMFMWQCGILLGRYYSYPKKVNVEIVQRPIPFPSVTVCNTDFLDMEVVQVLNAMLNEDLGHVGGGGGNGSHPPGMMGGMEGMGGHGEYDMGPGMDLGPGVDYGNYGYPDMSAYSDHYPAGAPLPSAEEEDTTNRTKDKNERFKERYAQFWDASTPIFSMAYPQLFAKEKIKEDMMEAYSRLGLAANLGAELSSLAGIQLNDFIASCRFMDDLCNITRSFIQHFDPYYFNCYTFNPEAILENRATRLKGVEYGLSLLLFTGSAGSIFAPGKDTIVPGMQESDSALASGRGTRVVVHPPDTMPHPTADGYDVPPGFSVTIGVKTRENVRIQYPHGNCTHDDQGVGFGYDNSSFRYTLMKCQNDCIQSTIMQSCACVDNRISTPEDTLNLPFCFKIPDLPQDTCSMEMIMAGMMGGPPGPDAAPGGMPKICLDTCQKWGDMLECRKDVYQNMTVKDPEAMDDICQCYPSCNDLTYDTSYSLSILPEKSDEHTAFYAMIDNFLLTGMSKSKQEIFMQRQGHQNNWTSHYSTPAYISRLNVHISDSNIIKTTESPDYEAIRLISDIGGQLGLWIGISVMTLFEVLQLIADVCRFLTVKGRHVGEKKRGEAKMMNSRFGNGQRFRPHNDLDVEMQCEIDKLTTV